MTSVMKKITTILLLFLSLLNLNGQTLITELNGFRIGQYRKTATNEFGKPLQQDKYEDGFEYEVFIINADSSLYMVFEYAAGNTDIIWSIQISGNNTSTDIGFKGLKLGLDKKDVERVLGKNYKKEDIGEYGEKWSYDQTNYSVEISKSGKLSSVKIIGDYASNTPDISVLPKFDDVVKILSLKNNADIASILAPGIEIYYKGQTMFFGKSFENEIETDFSKIFQTIREISIGLNKINTSDENAYEENMRVTEGQNPKHVVKLKKGHLIKEIVFEYINGQYLIGEIKT
jgi:hypothetical protein